MHLEYFSLPTQLKEDEYWHQKYTRYDNKIQNGYNPQKILDSYDNCYPFRIFPQKSLSRLDFEPITIFYGSNGSGKTSLLNIIAEFLSLRRSSFYNRSSFFEDYVSLCRASNKEVNKNSCIITSDDVFDYMLNLRVLNDEREYHRKNLIQEYFDKISNAKELRVKELKSLADYDAMYDILKEADELKKSSPSQYVKRKLMNCRHSQSNGESASQYFIERITENALYLLDEPENSLSPERQLDLIRYLEESARFFNCQFIIATHSPFILSIKGAKIYDLDSVPAKTKLWTELKNVQLYYEFFKVHEHQFK